MSAAQVCRECGHVFAPQETRELKVVEGELVEMQRQQRRQQGSAQSLQELIELGRRRGYKKPRGWAERVYQARLAKRYGE
jgi:hypothetical protein